LLQNTDESNKQTSEAIAFIRMQKQKNQAAGTAAQGFEYDQCEEDVAKQPST
jgi:hypothetical protein